MSEFDDSYEMDDVDSSDFDDSFDDTDFDSSDADNDEGWSDQEPDFDGDGWSDEGGDEGDMGDPVEGSDETDQEPDFDGDGWSDEDADEGSDETDQEPDFEEGYEIDESELSPAELKELADKETEESIREAEEWADEQGMDTWSDGTPREGAELSDESDEAFDQEAEEKALKESEEQEQREVAEQEAREQEEQEQEMNEQKEQAEKEMQEQNEREINNLTEQQTELINQYKELEALRASIAEGTENANDIDSAYRFAEDQRRVGEQMEELKYKAAEIQSQIDARKK